MMNGNCKTVAGAILCAACIVGPWFYLLKVVFS